MNVNNTHQLLTNYNDNEKIQYANIAKINTYMHIAEKTTKEGIPNLQGYPCPRTKTRQRWGGIWTTRERISPFQGPPFQGPPREETPSLQGSSRRRPRRDEEEFDPNKHTRRLQEDRQRLIRYGAEPRGKYESNTTYRTGVRRNDEDILRIRGRRKRKRSRERERARDPRRYQK